MNLASEKPHLKQRRDCDRRSKLQPTAKLLVILVVVGILAGVAVTLIQRLLLGNASAAVTGGVIGAFGALAFMILRKKSGS